MGGSQAALFIAEKTPVHDCFGIETKIYKKYRFEHESLAICPETLKKNRLPERESDGNRLD
jgi:hypothetical protein